MKLIDILILVFVLILISFTVIYNILKRKKAKKMKSKCASCSERYSCNQDRSKND